MSGCSLEDAFPDGGGRSSRISRKEERKRAEKCPGPALSFLKAQGQDEQDPDRLSPPLPPVERLKGSEGFTGNLVGQRVNDVIGQKARNTLPTTRKEDVSPTPAYFGKSLESSPSVSEEFADFSSSVQDNPGYLLGPKPQTDFLGSFGAVGLGKAGGVGLPPPNTDNTWKPLSKGGVTTSYVPNEHHETVLKKLDILFARLDDLESRDSDNSHVEVTMFILSGLFLLFGIESLRKF